MPKKILVVDDEPSYTKELCYFLESKGYSTVEAHNGHEALERYEQEMPDLVLLDMMMPGMSGLVTLRELKALDPGAKVIILTALCVGDLAKQAIDEGASDYITKSIGPDYFELALMTAFALHGIVEYNRSELLAPTNN